MKKKLILTDVDGVLLNWSDAMDDWLSSHNYIKGDAVDYDLAVSYNMEKNEKRRVVRMFNESVRGINLPPHKDAVKYVRKLREEHGFMFKAITSFSNDRLAQRGREDNLERVFGFRFDDVLCLGTGDDKDFALMPYRNTGAIWIEDKVENAELGVHMGLNVFLMRHEWSKGYKNPDMTIVDSWEEIYEAVK